MGQAPSLTRDLGEDSLIDTRARCLKLRISLSSVISTINKVTLFVADRIQFDDKSMRFLSFQEMSQIFDIWFSGKINHLVGPLPPLQPGSWCVGWGDTEILGYCTQHQIWFLIPRWRTLIYNWSPATIPLHYKLMPS